MLDNQVMIILNLENSNYKMFQIEGELHDQGDAKWIVIRRQLRGLNDTPYGQPEPGRPIDRPVSGRP
jgi:hypothetical protein